MATTNQVLKARVERGAALLDAEQPGWASRIDVPTLDMSSGYACVLGQVYEPGSLGSGYGTGIQALGIIGNALGTVSHGFNYDSAGDDTRLLPLWREAIEARCGGSER